MSRLGRVSFILLAVVLLAVVPSSSRDKEETDDQTDFGTNLLLTINVGSLEDGIKRSYKIVALADASQSELLVGWRTPIPTSRDEDGSAVSYVYQNVGMTVRLDSRLLGNDRARIRGAIEISGAREAAETPTPESGMPVIGTFQQQLDVVLQLGKPLRVAEVPDPDGGQLFLELQADRM